ncbi:MAG: ABC transporter substrate-binding protein [Alphaproteobacteria bacterium]
MPQIIKNKTAFHNAFGAFNRLRFGVAALSISAGLVFGAFAGGNAASAQTSGVTDTKILLGQAAALEGAAASLGIGMRQGMLAAFNEVNKAGGINGRTIDLISYDDGYEPTRSIDQVRKLINEDRVFALVGAVGTPTASATQPIATEFGVPYIGAFTGAGFLRNAEFKNVINVRATYAAETEAWIKYLVDEQGMERIALLYQDDGFGRVGLSGVTAALERRGMKTVAEATYQRNTTAVKTSLITIRREKPDAVVMVGAYKPIASFIRVAKSIDFTPTFVNISFVGSSALQEALGAMGEGVIISQVVPYPWNRTIPLVDQYTNALRNNDPNADPDFVTLEGYIVGRLVAEALKGAGRDLTRENFLDAIYDRGRFDLGGVVMQFGNGDNQGMDDVFLTFIGGDGQFQEVNSQSN